MSITELNPPAYADEPPPDDPYATPAPQKDREWRATHCIECYQAPEQCDKCGCHDREGDE